MITLLNLLQIHILQFKQLLTDEEFMTIMKINKNFRMLKIGDEYVWYTLKYKNFELDKICDFYYVYNICVEYVDEDKNDVLSDIFPSNIDEFICTKPCPNNVIDTCDLLYIHYKICDKINAYHIIYDIILILIVHFIIHNKIILLEWYFHNGFCKNINIFNICVENMNYDILNWAIEKKTDNKICAQSLLNVRDFDLLKLLFEKDIYIDGDICYDASYYEKYDLLKWIIENTDIRGEIYYGNIIRRDNLDIFKFIINKNLGFIIDDYNYIYKCKAYDILKWTIEYDIYTDKISFTNIIENDEIDILKLIINKGIVPNIDIIYHASLHNKIDILKWIIENTDIKGKIASKNIIKYNNLKLIISCFTKNFKFDIDDDYFCYNVSNNKCYDILKWMIENNIYTDHIYFKHIVRDGRIDILKLCVKYNVKIYTNIHKYTYLYNDYEIFKWLFEEKKLNGEIPFRDIVYYDNFDILKFAINNGLDFDIDIVYYASLNKKFDFLEWIIENSNITGRISFENIIRHGDLELFKLCITKDFKIDIDICKCASLNKKFDILEWTIKNTQITGDISFKNIIQHGN